MLISPVVECRACRQYLLTIGEVCDFTGFFALRLDRTGPVQVFVVALLLAACEPGGTIEIFYPD
jgi:hypothetical protein